MNIKNWIKSIDIHDIIGLCIGIGFTLFIIWSCYGVFGW